MDTVLDSKVKKATERISENIHIIANEPSLAFYRLQEHVRKALPSVVEKRIEVMKLYQNLQGHCYDAEYSLSAIKSISNADDSFQKTEDLLKDAIFYKQQIKYRDSQRSTSSARDSTAYRFSAHIPDIPDALRGTANRVESIMSQARSNTSDSN